MVTSRVRVFQQLEAEISGLKGEYRVFGEGLHKKAINIFLPSKILTGQLIEVFSKQEPM